jgi:hypothetical protein
MLPPKLHELVTAPAPGFRCIAASSKSRSSFVARICHTLRPPASSEQLEYIRKRLGEYATQVIDFYRENDGFVLYRDTLSDAAGFELLPIEQWYEATEDMKDSLSYIAEVPDNDPDHILTGVAIATVPHSGNYFVMPIEGNSAGSIFYANHDGWYESAFTESFEGLLTRLVENPVNLLNKEFGCYTRYSDGKTEVQWIPEEYFRDVTEIGS